MTEYNAEFGRSLPDNLDGAQIDLNDQEAQRDDDFPIPLERPEIRRAVVQLAVPMAVGEIVQFIVLFGIVALLGRMGSQALYIRSVYMPAAFLFLGLSSGFDISSQVAASTCCGRNRPQDVPGLVFSMTRVWLGLAGAICLLLVFGAPGLASLVHVDQAARGEFVSFMRWTSLAELSIIGMVMCTSVLRGFGHAREAAAVTVTCAAVELGGVAVLGIGLGMGVYSVPVTTALAGAVGLALGLALARRKGLLKSVSFAWEPAAAGYLIQVGVPVALSLFVITVYDLVILWVLAPFGVGAVAGFSAAFTVQSLVITPAIVLGSATSIIMNQQRGAGEHSRLGQTFTVALQVSVLLYLALAMLAWVLAGPIAHLMTGDPAISTQTQHYLGVVALTFLIQGPVLVALTVMEQTGAGFLATGLNVTYFLAIAVIGGILARSAANAEPLYRTVAVANLAGISVLFVALAVVRRLRDDASSPVPA